MNPRFYALFAALLFGASAPLAKVLLNSLQPVQMAAFLYLGCGFGLVIVKIFNSQRKLSIEAKLSKSDIKWLSGAVLTGGVLAPIVLMISLKRTPAATSSLLLNFESVGTMLIAFIFFHEHIGKRLFIAISLITIASILLTFSPNSEWGISIGTLGVLLSCLLWGIDNNFTRNISSKDPYITVIVKGLVAGTISLAISFFIGEKIPGLGVVLLALILGGISYGASLFLFILSLRKIGTSRTSALFGLAPFLGVAISLLILHEPLTIKIVLAFVSVNAFHKEARKHQNT